MANDITLDAVAERILREADGDRKRAYDSIAHQYSGSEYAELVYCVTQKFVAVEKAAAARIFAEAAGDRDRASELLRGFTELKCTFESTQSCGENSATPTTRPRAESPNVAIAKPTVIAA